MPAYKDEKTNTWYCKFYYEDVNGIKKQKMKRGFQLQREAKEWERNFLETKALDVNIKFKNFVEVYYQDIDNRLRLNTAYQKKFIINEKLLPFFGEMVLSDIKSIHVREWQNSLLTYQDENGKGYSQTYLKTINSQLSAIFNYAVRYYNLRENPCVKAGSMGKAHAEEMQFYTLDEFKQFIQACDNPVSYAAFNILYYTGIRSGELLALTWNDIDLENMTINIDKSYHRIKKQDVITKPKTPKSIRTIVIFEHLAEIIKEYKKSIYKPHGNDRVFSKHTHRFLQHEIIRVSNKAGLKQIRVHDLRHSHASLLIELGFSPLLIAERLGHEKLETTLNTYSHLYPNKQVELADKLQKLVSN